MTGERRERGKGAGSGSRFTVGNGFGTGVLLTVFAVYFYVFMEWLFFVTKPSFMTKLGWGGRLGTLFAAPAPLIVAGIAAVALLWIPAAASKHRIVRRVCAAAARVPSAAVLTLACFLLVDNFTYTVLRFGIRTTHGISRLAYVVLLVALFAFAYQMLGELGARLRERARFRTAAVAAAALALGSILAVVSTIDLSGLDLFRNRRQIIPLANRPNFILLSIDGLNADHLSVYGYGRDTTPFLGEIAENALLCENCYVNADASSGSIVSMLTGKMPTTTRVLYAPDVLRGEDVYRHLPGILRGHGYRNFDISVRHHADPIDLNMQESFDWVNFRKIKAMGFREALVSVLGERTIYFLGKMSERILDRLSHVFGVRGMDDPMSEVVGDKKKFSRDAERIKALFERIDESRSPFFAHVHLIGTHGPKFNPRKRLFSAGREQDEPWMTDFYDDAIREADDQIREIMEGLRKRRISHNTAVIVCTDHAQRWRVDDRVPLMFIFPYGEHAGRIGENAQNLDIAPTILDYLGIERPDWMAGRSLLSPDIESRRFIFTATRKREKTVFTPKGLQLDSRRIGPPFYTLGSVGIFYRDWLYDLELEEGKLVISRIAGHTAPCAEADLPDPQEVGRMILDHLAENGYDISSIGTPLTVEVVR